VAEFIGVKSWKAKGKRLSNYEVGNIKEIEPIVKDEHDKPDPDGIVEIEELEESEELEQVEPAKPKVKLSFDEIPFEIKRPKKDAPDPTQMSLF
jgi:topoisomerase-4 subunit A